MRGRRDRGTVVPSTLVTSRRVLCAAFVVGGRRPGLSTEQRIDSYSTAPIPNGRSRL